MATIKGKFAFEHMTLYFLPIILAFVFYSIKELKHSKLTLYILLDIYVFLCFGYMTGSD